MQLGGFACDFYSSIHVAHLYLYLYKVKLLQCHLPFERIDLGQSSVSYQLPLSISLDSINGLGLYDCLSRPLLLGEWA